MCIFRVKEWERERKRETTRVRERENMCVCEREKVESFIRDMTKSACYGSLVQKSPIKEIIFCKRDLSILLSVTHPIERERVQILHVGPRVCVTWRIHMCEMTHAYAWHDSFICVTWLIEWCHKPIVKYRARLRKMTCNSTPPCTDSHATHCMQSSQPKRQHNTPFSHQLSTLFQQTDVYAVTHACSEQVCMQVFSHSVLAFLSHFLSPSHNFCIKEARPIFSLSLSLALPPFLSLSLSWFFT